MTSPRDRSVPPPRRTSTTKVGALVAGRYAVQSRLARGGMSCVYRAEDTKTGALVAIKILEPEQVVRPGGLDAFIREAQAARAAAHPNIVRTLDEGQRSDGRPYLVMELLEGETLGERLDRDRTLPVTDALLIGVEIADALAAAHAAGVVHRDLKSDNVFLVGPRSAHHTAKLLDFGLAELQVGVALYGLGVVLFHALTGQVPFEGPDEVVVLAHQVLSPAPPAGWITEGLPPGLEAILTAALRTDPGHRYPSMDAMRADLSRIARVPPEPVQPPPADPGGDRYAPKSSHAAAAMEFLKSRL
jgi:serine/threonine-protein kinase